MAKYKTQLKSFDTSKLKHVNFGKLEGEKDDKLKASFLSTNSIEKFLEVKYNYILSPKGGGKSAVFRAMRDKLISSFEYDKYSVITINSAFGFDEELAEGFKEESITKIIL